MDQTTVLSRWVQYMQAEDLTPRTIQDRTQFINHVTRITTGIFDITRQDLIGFLAHNPDLANSTKQHYRSALHTFFTWLQDEGYRLDNPAAKLPRVKARTREATPLTAAEIERVLKGGAYRRTRIMVALHYYQGFRVSEIAQVHGRDVDWYERTISTVGKGRKKRVLPVSDALWEIIKDMPQNAYWFPNWKTNRLYQAGEGHILGGSVSSIISGAMKRAGVAGHRPHDLRSSTATLQSRAGVSPFVIQKNMRHANMDTTSRYTSVGVDEMRDGFNSLPVVQMPSRSGRTRAA